MVSTAGPLLQLLPGGRAAEANFDASKQGGGGVVEAAAEEETEAKEMAQTD